MINSILKRINLNTIIKITIVIILFLYLLQCNRLSNLSEDLKISKMNQIALVDTITSYKDKNETLVFEKSTLIASKKELQHLNIELYNELTKLRNNPKIIIKEIVVVKHDTIKLETKIIKYKDGSIGLSWDRDTTFSSGNYQKLAGETKFNLDSNGTISNVNTSLNTNEFGISIVTGLTDNGDTYKIFVKSDYPGLKINDIQGSILDKNMIKSNESSFVIGPSIGYGIVVNDKLTSNGVFIGVTVTYNINKKIKNIFRPFGL